MSASNTTTRFVAFLRAINVGGRRVKMDRLREVFEDLGFRDVETFIASGNVIFSSPESEARVLEEEIEAHLLNALGYEVNTFLRSTTELANVVALQPFEPADPEEGSTLFVAFLAASPDEAARSRLMECESRLDTFHIHGREVYWLCRGRTSDSNFSNALLEKRIGSPATVRNVTTVSRLAAKYPA